MYIILEKYRMENGLMTGHKVREFTIMSMEPNTRVNGMKINRYFKFNL